MINSNTALGTPNFSNESKQNFKDSSALTQNALSHPQTVRPAPKRNLQKRLVSGKSRRNPASGPKTRPAFVLKLWNMVNDKTNETYIRWMPDGQSFQVLNREQFEKIVLPKYFKHSNFSSFVRQLNMYGWHKVQDVTSGAMQSNEEIWQFKSPNFIRGCENLLDNIVRNKGSKGSDDEDDDYSKLFDELELIKVNQRTIANDLVRIRKDNDSLWRECYESRERHKSHSEAFEKILRFLASIYTSNQNKFVSNGTTMPGGHKQPLLLLPNLQEQNEKSIFNDNETNNQALSAIEDLISNASNASSPNDSRLYNNISHHRISSIGSVDGHRPIITEADTPSSTASSSSPPANPPTSTANNPSKHRRTGSKVKLEEVSDETGSPIISQNQVSRRVFSNNPQSNQTSVSNFSPSAMNLIPSVHNTGYDSSHRNTDFSDSNINKPNTNQYTTDNIASKFSTFSSLPASNISSQITNALSTLSNYNNSPRMKQSLLNNNQSLDSITRSLEAQDHSLQLASDWVQKLAPEYNMDFTNNYRAHKDLESIPDLDPPTSIGTDSSLYSAGLGLGTDANVMGGPTGIPAMDSATGAGVDLGVDVPGTDSFNVDDFLNNNDLLDGDLSGTTIDGGDSLGDISVNDGSIGLSGISDKAQQTSSNHLPIMGLDPTSNLKSNMSQSTDRLLTDLGLEPPTKKQKIQNDSGNQLS